MAVIVNEEDCLGCEACAEVCPLEAITIENDIAIISDKCLECGICLGACPVSAIHL